jgi:hypothetical protein
MLSLFYGIDIRKNAAESCCLAERAVYGRYPLTE